jgi:hypothetical protein
MSLLRTSCIIGFGVIAASYLACLGVISLSKNIARNVPAELQKGSGSSADLDIQSRRDWSLEVRVTLP